MNSGSSPLTRGKLQDLAGKYTALGLIPAHAGKTATGSVATSTQRAHPRSRGENEAAIQAGADTAGSSPLTRGKPPSDASAFEDVGLIPAHAGKTTGRLPG